MSEPKDLIADYDETKDVRRRFQGDLRAAREAVLGDAEGFEVVVHAIERLGQHFVEGGTGLGDYEDVLLELVVAAKLDTDRLRERLFLLRQTRNDHAHRGAYARNAAREAVDVALILEDALAGGWGDVELRDVMTSNPLITQPGDKLGDVRQRMLANAYSAIPTRVGEQWYLLTDRWLAGLLVGKGTGKRRVILESKVDDAVREHAPEVATVLRCDTKLSALKDGDALHAVLILVGASPACERLEGVLAPADLL